MEDFLLDESNDMIIKNGDFLIGNSTEQNQKNILLATKGEFKEHPEVGVGLINYILEDNPKQMLIDAQRQFEYDGMTVNILNSDENGNININANYGR